jgi:hypothetical protein
METFYHPISVVSPSSGPWIRLTSPQGGGVDLSIDSAVVGRYSIRMPTDAPTAQGQVLSASTDGSLSWSSAWDPSKVVTITNDTPATGLGSGAIQVTGGGSFGGAVYVGQNIQASAGISVGTDQTGLVSIQPSGSGFGYTLVLPAEPPYATDGVALVSDSAGQLRWGKQLKSFSADQNVSAMRDVEGLNLDDKELGNYDVLVSVTTAGTNRVSKTFLEIFRNGLGTYTLSQRDLGDSTGITFGVSPDGQIRYTSPAFPAWGGTEFVWYA